MDTRIVGGFLGGTLYYEAAWRRHASNQNNTISSCPTTGENRYEAQYARYAQKNYPGTCTSWRMFAAMKSFTHIMRAWGLEQDYYDFCGSRVNFLNGRLQTNSNADHIYLVNHAIVILFEKNFRKSLPTDSLKFALMQSLSFVLPITPKSLSKQSVVAEDAAGINPDQPSGLFQITQ